MKTTQFLNEKHVIYNLTEHPGPTYTAQQLAAAEHVSGMEVAKPVVVNADDKYYMCVLPACRMVDFDTLKKQLGVQSIRLVEEDEMCELFSDSELGAEPPIGSLYGLDTILDKSMLQSRVIVFQAGTHHQAIYMCMDDFQELTHPVILDFSYSFKDRPRFGDYGDDPFYGNSFWDGIYQW